MPMQKNILYQSRIKSTYSAIEKNVFTKSVPEQEKAK